MVTIEEARNIYSKSPVCLSMGFSIKKMDVESANDLFLIEEPSNDNKFCLKIYNNTQQRAAMAKESVIYETIKPIYSSITTILHFGALHQKEYSISKHIDGVSLLDAYLDNLSNEAFLQSVSKHLVKYIDSCGSISTKKYGLLSDELTGTLNCWTDFLYKNLQSIQKSIDNISAFNHPVRHELLPFVENAQQFISKNHEHFAQIIPKLTPVDLNLTNFMIETHSNKVIAIDLEAFVSGDPLLAFGELFGHVHLTSLGDSLKSIWSRWTTEEKKRIHFYAFLSNLNVLSFIIANSKESIIVDSLKPWGNNNSFIKLLHLHQQQFCN